jgi:hypothetical protein
MTPEMKEKLRIGRIRKREADTAQYIRDMQRRARQIQRDRNDAVEKHGAPLVIVPYDSRRHSYEEQSLREQIIACRAKGNPKHPSEIKLCALNPDEEHFIVLDYLVSSDGWPILFDVYRGFEIFTKEEAEQFAKKHNEALMARDYFDLWEYILTEGQELRVAQTAGSIEEFRKFQSISREFKPQYYEG